MPRVWNKRHSYPPDAVYVGRPSKWGNPFKVGRDVKGRLWTRTEVIQLYRSWVTDQHELMLSLHELKGKDLVCWCAPLPCHADILLELANA